MTPLNFHTFRDWDARLGRFIRFNGAEVPEDTKTERTPVKAPEKKESTLVESESQELDQRLGEMGRLLDEWNDELSSGGDLSADNPFNGLGSDLIPTARHLLDEAYRELSTQHEQGLERAFTEFRTDQGPIGQELSEVLLAASNSWGLTEGTARTPSAAPRVAAVPSASTEVYSIKSSHVVEPGDTMFAILNKKLSDPTYKAKVASLNQLDSNLPTQNLVLQLFRKVPELKQDLIYPQDRVLFAPNGAIAYEARPDLRGTPAPLLAPGQEEVPKAAPAGDGLAEVEEPNEGEQDPNADRSDSPRAPTLEAEPADGEPAGTGADAALAAAGEADAAAPARTAPGAPAGEATAEPAPEESEPTITESEKLGDLTVNYGEGVHELLYRYGIAEGKLQFKESSPNVYTLDPETFPKGTTIPNPSDVTCRFLLAADYLKNNLSIDSSSYTEITIWKESDTVLHIRCQPKNGTSPLDTIIHLPELIENRGEQIVEAVLGEFSEAEINPADIQITHEADPNDSNLNQISIHLNKLVIRGRIYGGFDAKATAPDAEEAQKQAIANLRDQVKTLYEKTIKDQHEATLAALPHDFPALKEYVQNHPEIYDLSFEQHPLPGDASGTVGVEMKLTFKIHGILTNFSISKERGPNLAEAIRRTQNTLMEILAKHDTGGPLEGDHPRSVAPSTAEGAVDTRKTETILVSDAEKYIFFRDSIRENFDGSVAFKFYPPLAELNYQEPGTGRLSTDGTLTLSAPGGLNVQFRLSYTALSNGKEIEQPLDAVRFGETATAAAHRQGNPWLQHLTDRTGKVTGMDMVITDDLLYNIVRDALSKKVPQPNGPDRPAPETFAKRYDTANDFHDVKKHIPRDQLLYSQGNYLWVKPIVGKP